MSNRELIADACEDKQSIFSLLEAKRKRERLHCSRSGFHQKKYGRGVDVEAAVHLRRVDQDLVDYIRVYRVAPLLAARRAEVHEGHAGFFMETFKDDIGELSQTHNTF